MGEQHAWACALETVRRRHGQVACPAHGGPYVRPAALAVHDRVLRRAVAGILTQAAYSPALVYIDSYRYLTGDSSLDPLGYLALLWPLQHAGGLAAVAAAQHILGLGMALALYAVLLRRGMWRWAAALAAAPVLLDGYQLQAEQTIMPDVLFEALIVAGLTLLLWRRIPAAWQVGLAGLALGVAVDVRQVGEVLISRRWPSC